MKELQELRVLKFDSHEEKLHQELGGPILLCEMCYKAPRAYSVVWLYYPEPDWKMRSKQTCNACLAKLLANVHLLP